jgi:hypothetical protein
MINRSILLAFLLLSSSWVVRAQQLSGGLVGGFNYATQSFTSLPLKDSQGNLIAESSTTTYQYHPGLKLGALLHLPITDIVAFTPRLLYNQKGLTYPQAINAGLDSSYTIVNKVRLDYLSLDLPLKVQLPHKTLMPYLLVGLRVDAVLGYRQSLETPAHRGRYRGGYGGYYDYFNKLNVGMLLGVGVEKRVSSRLNLFLEGEYNPDLRYAHSKPWTLIKNTMVALNTGIRWSKN